MPAMNCSEVFDYDKIDFTSLLQNNKQYGGGKFVGFRNQRGRGLAGVVKRLRIAIPSFLESPVGKQVAQAPASVATDVMIGSTASDAFKRAGRRTIRNLTGLGSRKRPSPSSVLTEKRSFFVPAP